MSDDPVARKLSQFRPDASGLDRDALLFAAGRAAARPNRGLVALVAALTVSQLVTLSVFLWPQHSDYLAPTSPARNVPIRAIELPRPPDHDGPRMMTLRERMIEAEENLPLPSPVESLIPPEAPLRAFGPFPVELVN